MRFDLQVQYASAFIDLRARRCKLAERRSRTVILGIDAAWTPHHASGVALVTGEPGRWRCLAALPSYQDFYHRAGCTGVPQAAAAIAGAEADLASVDMPLARVPVTSRRACDTAISRAFGACGCSVHSSSPDRPGAVSTALMAAFSEAGYELAVKRSAVRFRQVIEVYPHIAVMRLVDAAYRVPYKLGRIRQYWPHATPAARRENLRANLAKILGALHDRIADIPLELPPAEAGPARMKRFEDALDAIVCAWIGTRYVEGRCLAYGDETAAIWVPN